MDQNFRQQFWLHACGSIACEKDCAE